MQLKACPSHAFASPSRRSSLRQIKQTHTDRLGALHFSNTNPILKHRPDLTCPAARQASQWSGFLAGIGVPTARKSAFAACFAGFCGIELVRVAAGMRCLAAPAGDLALALGIHRGKTPTACR